MNFISFNRIDAFKHLCLNKLASKNGKRLPYFLYTFYKARKMSKSCSQSFITVFPFSFVSNAMNFFIYSLNRLVLKKCSLCVDGFL